MSLDVRCAGIMPDSASPGTETVRATGIIFNNTLHDKATGQVELYVGGTRIDSSSFEIDPGTEEDYALSGSMTFDSTGEFPVEVHTRGVQYEDQRDSSSGGSSDGSSGGSSGGSTGGELECYGDSDCPAGYECAPFGGDCRKIPDDDESRCEGNLDCPPGMYCSRREGTCYSSSDAPRAAAPGDPEAEIDAYTPGVYGNSAQILLRSLR